MQNKDKNDIGELEEEHRDRVFERYENKSNIFRRILISVVLSSLAFFFLIVFPYISIQVENSIVSEKLDGVKAQIEQRQKPFEVYQKAQEGIQELEQGIQKGPIDLRNFILSLPLESSWSPRDTQTQEPTSRQSGPIQFVGPCDFETNYEAWINCKVKEYLKSEISDYRRVINQVLEPLQTLPAEAQSPIGVLALENQLGNLQNSFESKVDENPRFWETYQGKTEVFSGFEEELSLLWKDYGFVIEEQSLSLEKELSELQKQEKELTTQLTRLQDQESNLAERLNQMESPIGNLSVGLIESVLAFPLVLAIAFYVCTSLFCETTRLRRILHNLYQKNDPNKTILTDQQISLIAPLWIDPINYEQNKTLNFIILLTPLFVFAAAISLIFLGWTIPDAFPGVGELYRQVYFVLYVLSFGAFAYGIWRVVKELRHYSVKAQLFT